MSTATPEGRVKEEVKKIFKRHNVWYFMPVPGGYGANGMSDFICLGLKLVVECKAKDGMKPTALQQKFMDDVVVAGGYAFVATPGNLEALEKLIEGNKGRLGVDAQRD